MVAWPSKTTMQLSNTLQKRYHKLRQGEMFVIR